jgi:hypothetical protein
MAMNGLLHCASGFLSNAWRFQRRLGPAALLYGNDNPDEIPFEYLIQSADAWLEACRSKFNHKNLSKEKKHFR